MCTLPPPTLPPPPATPPVAENKHFFILLSKIRIVYLFAKSQLPFSSAFKNCLDYKISGIRNSAAMYRTIGHLEKLSIDWTEFE